MENKQTMTVQQEDEAARAAQREYTRQYRAAHPDKVKAWNRAYWLRKAQRAAQDGGGQNGA